MTVILRSGVEVSAGSEAAQPIPPYIVILESSEMKSLYSLRSRHVRDDEVNFNKRILRTKIKVSRKNRGEEEIGYSIERQKHLESALSHEHGATTYLLNSYKKDVFAVLREADNHFQFERRLIGLYPDLKWSSHQSDDMYWEGQRSILVGRCDGEVVSITGLDVRFVSEAITSRTKYLSIGVGPFFVPAHLRGRGHSVEMSIALSYFCSVLFTALYKLLPVNGYLGGIVYPEYLTDANVQEVHPFVQQIFEKLQVVREMLVGGYLSQSVNYHSGIKLLPLTLER